MKLKNFSANTSTYLCFYSHKVIYLSVYIHYFIFYEYLDMIFGQNGVNN